jgi:AraC-like DNA-binding protein
MGEMRIPFVTLPNWLKAAQRSGFNIEPIFRRHGVAIDLINREQATIGVSTLTRIMEDCINETKGGHFPFVLGETFAFEYLPDLETFITTSGSIRDAARVFGWLRDLINPLVDVRLEEGADLAHVVLLDAPGWSSLERHFQSESIFASIVRFGRELLGERGHFQCLRFRHPQPEYVGAYQRHFQMPLAFSQPRYELEFDRALLDMPLRGAAPLLHRQAEYLVKQRLTRHSRAQSATARVAAVLADDERLLAGDMANAAAALGMGPRTLQRRLKAEGASFAEIQTQARYRKAVELLRMPESTVESVAESLGFSDRRSFTRAFKRWSGHTPSRFRHTS